VFIDHICVYTQRITYADWVTKPEKKIRLCFRSTSKGNLDLVNYSHGKFDLKAFVAKL